MKIKVLTEKTTLSEQFFVDFLVYYKRMKSVWFPNYLLFVGDIDTGWTEFQLKDNSITEHDKKFIYSKFDEFLNLGQWCNSDENIDPKEVIRRNLEKWHFCTGFNHEDIMKKDDHFILNEKHIRTVVEFRETTIS